jgi:enoyl-[acyl-carrier protein] reductase II
MGGAMSWISEHKLVSSISNAGGFGVIACSSMSPEQLENEILLTKQCIGGKEFGVNLILMHPNIDELINVCIKNKITHIILAGGIPSKDLIGKIKVNNIKAITFAPSISVAKKMVRIGIDALIIEGMEAGGHIGKVSTSVLAQEILPEITDVPVFIAGGIGTGKIIVNYLKMGASGCQIGTLFACSKESIAHPKFKQKFINASSYDTVISTQLDSNFPVIPVRSIKNNATKDFTDFQKSIIEQYNNGLVSKSEGQLAIEKFWAGSLRRAVIDGDVESGSLMAGEIVGLIKKELPVQEIIDNIVSDAESYIENFYINRP